LQQMDTKHNEVAKSHRTYLQKKFTPYRISTFHLSFYRALWNLYIVHSPTTALFIKLGDV